MDEDGRGVPVVREPAPLDPVDVTATDARVATPDGDVPDPAGSDPWPGLESLPASPPTAWGPARPYRPRHQTAAATPWVPPVGELPPPGGTVVPDPAVAATPASRSRRPLVVLAAVLLVGLAVAGSVVLPTRPSVPDDATGPPTTNTPERTPTTTTTTTTATTGSTTEVPAPSTTPAPTDLALEQAVTETAAFVSEARGRSFTPPPEVVRLPDDAFEERIRAGYDVDALVARGHWLELLGLVEIGTDYAQRYLEDAVRNTAAFFDPASKQVVLRGQPGAEVTDDDREILVHELTHVLDDQFAPFGRPELRDPTTEVAFGSDALIEGDAMRVAHRWNSAHGRTSPLEPTVFPDLVTAQIAAKYAYGEPLANAAGSWGGEPEVDRALLDPPVTSEQVLHPLRYQVREPELAVERPAGPTGLEVADGPPVGELLTSQLLAVRSGDRQAGDAAAGWGGDRSVFWVQPPSEGGLTCLRIRYAMDTAPDLDQLATAFEIWARGDDTRRVDRAAGSIDVTTCGPVPPPPGLLPD